MTSAWYLFALSSNVFPAVWVAFIVQGSGYSNLAGLSFYSAGAEGTHSIIGKIFFLGNITRTPRYGNISFHYSAIIPQRSLSSTVL